MQKILKSLLIILVSFLIVSCESMNSKNESSFLSKDPITSSVGSPAGFVVANQKFVKIDDKDNELSVKNAARALDVLPSGNSSEWSNSESGNYGSISPIRTFKENGRYCREYIQSLVLEGKNYKLQSKACKKPDGSWKIIEN